MPKFGPIKRQELVRGLRLLGFEGPFAGGRHAFMIRGAVTVRIPNPHRGDINKGFLARILREAGVEKSDWERI